MNYFHFANEKSAKPTHRTRAVGYLRGVVHSKKSSYAPPKNPKKIRKIPKNPKNPKKIPQIPKIRKIYKKYKISTKIKKIIKKKQKI